MIKNILTVAFLASSLGLLAGCGGSDSDSVNVSTTNDITEEITEEAQTGSAVFDNVWGPDTKFKLEGPIYAYIDKVTRDDVIKQFENQTPDNAIVMDAADIIANRGMPKTESPFDGGANGGRRFDIFQDGQITFADVVMHLSDTDPRFKAEPTWSEDLLGFKWTVWYDANNDGEFTYDGDGYENYANPDWYVNYILDMGDFKRELLYDARGEALYMRLEMVHLQNESGVLIRHTNPAMTARREAIWKAQADRRRDWEASEDYVENTILFPEVDLQPIGITPDQATEDNVNFLNSIGVGDGEYLVDDSDTQNFKNVVVKSHNLRPDIYKNDAAFTFADVLLSLDEQDKIEIGYTYWGTMQTDVPVNHFWLNNIAGRKTFGSVGYMINYGEKESLSDFKGKYNLYYHFMGSGNKGPSYCDTHGEGGVGTDPDGILDEECVTGFAEISEQEGRARAEILVEQGLITPSEVEEFVSYFMENYIDVSDWFCDQEFHFFTDVWMANYPGDYITASPISMYNMYQPASTLRLGEDEDYPTYDITAAKETLDDTHFGWGYSDCSLCHSLDDIHVGGNVGADVSTLINEDGELDANGLPALAPYKCAQCHGGNGAPAGHGEVTRCYWCHSKDLNPQNHGNFSGDWEYENYPGNSEEIFFQARESIDVPATVRQTAELQQELSQDPVIGGALNAPNLDLTKVLYQYPEKDEDGNVIAVGSDGSDTIPMTNYSDDNVSWQAFWGTYDKYGDGSNVRVINRNNDWHTDGTYPDPYSCVTCHPNKEE